jgi:hypothetical protein
VKAPGFNTWNYYKVRNPVFTNFAFQMRRLVPLRYGGQHALMDERTERIRRLQKTWVVGLYTSNAVDPWLETAWFQPLNLSSENLVSSLCFQKFNLCRCGAGCMRSVISLGTIMYAGLTVSTLDMFVFHKSITVGRYKLNSVDS